MTPPFDAVTPRSLAVHVYHDSPADTMIDAGQQYWEVRFDKESKAFAVGVALRSLGRFDQLGKSSASWCIHLNNWLQQSLTAKHNNKARTLDCPIPSSIGVYCNYEEGEIDKRADTSEGVTF